MQKHASHNHHSYRVLLVPPNTPTEDIAKLANAGLLRCERLRASSAEQAARHAFLVYNLPVHSVERIEEVAA